MPFWAYALAALGGYLLGSLPTGYLVGRARGVDIRREGSGNIGATNALRVLGKAAGLFVLTVDALKGLLAVLALGRWLPRTVGVAPGGTDLTAVVAGVAAILGHNYTCWLGFKGGKGIATSAGVLLALMPAALGWCCLVWGVVFALSRYASLASISAAAALPFAVWFTGHEPLLTGVGLALGALAIYKHRANIRRLLEGTEHRWSRSPRTPSPSRSPE
jgi:glycerol-3-phosphate acyltransferase PlsY